MTTRHKNYHIMFWPADIREQHPASNQIPGTYSIYNRYNSMYDCKDGFKSVAEAVAYIDKYRD
jgi:hypothetical protein